MENHFGDRDDYTGGTAHPKMKEDSIIKIVSFEQYLIGVRLTPEGQFIGIEEIAVNKDFRSFKQKNSQRIIHFIDEYYPEE